MDGEDIITIFLLVLAYGSPIGIVVFGFMTGRYIERKHLAELDRRESAVSNMIVCNTKSLPPNWQCTQCDILASQVVIGSDAFKTFIMQLRNLFGGELRGLGALMLRARREALLRVVEDAQAQGANAVWNVRYETSTIGRGKGKQGLVSAEVMAYGTALWITQEK